MARTAAGAELTRQHRAQQLSIRAAVLRSLVVLWRLVDPTNLSGTIGPFARATARLVQTGNRDSASAATTYYLAFRGAEGVQGALSIAQGASPDLEVIAGALRGAGLAGVINARRRGVDVGAATRNGFVRTAGASSSLVLAGGRQAIIEASNTDPAAVGWQRVTDADPCAFCAMLVGRGPVYRSQAAAETVVGRRGTPRGTRQLGDSFHEHCACGAEAVFEVGPLTAQAERYRDLWEQTTAGLDGKDALNAFRREIEGRPAPGDPAEQSTAA